MTIQERLQLIAEIRSRREVIVTPKRNRIVTEDADYNDLSTNETATRKRVKKKKLNISFVDKLSEADKKQLLEFIKSKIGD